MTDAICKHGNAISLKPSINFVRCKRCDDEADAQSPQNTDAAALVKLCDEMAQWDRTLVEQNPRTALNNLLTFARALKARLAGEVRQKWNPSFMDLVKLLSGHFTYEGNAVAVDHAARDIYNALYAPLPVVAKAALMTKDEEGVAPSPTTPSSDLQPYDARGQSTTPAEAAQARIDRLDEAMSHHAVYDGKAAAVVRPDDLHAAITALRTRSAATPGEGMNAEARRIIALIEKQISDDYENEDNGRYGPVSRPVWQRDQLLKIIASGIIHPMPGREEIAEMLPGFAMDKHDRLEAADALLAFLGRP